MKIKDFLLLGAILLVVVALVVLAQPKSEPKKAFDFHQYSQESPLTFSVGDQVELFPGQFFELTTDGEGDYWFGNGEVRVADGSTVECRIFCAKPLPDGKVEIWGNPDLK